MRFAVIKEKEVYKEWRNWHRQIEKWFNPFPFLRILESKGNINAHSSAVSVLTNLHILVHFNIFNLGISDCARARVSECLGNLESSLIMHVRD